MDIIQNKPITKEDITNTAAVLLEQLDNGSVNPLGLLARFKAVEKLHEAIKPVLTDLAVREASKHKEKEIALFGAVFKLGEFGTKYSYELCGDPVLKELEEKAKEATEALKARQDFLKGIKGSETIVIPDTAEIVTVYAPVKTSVTSVSCSIK